MFTVIIIVALVIGVILTFAVLIQNPKGGGLSGYFGGAATQLFGYKRTSDDIEKITWGLGAVILVLCLSAAAFKPTATAEEVTPFSGQAEKPVYQAPPMENTAPAAGETAAPTENTNGEAGASEELPK
jgi:preprotein translocase subunit SecG